MNTTQSKTQLTSSQDNFLQTLCKAFEKKVPPSEKNMEKIMNLLNKNEQIQFKLQEEEKEINGISKRIDELQQFVNIRCKEIKEKKMKKKNRRIASDIERQYNVRDCPYSCCDKRYGSDISLNLHIRIKHNGGSKIERENLAQNILIAKIKGESVPQCNINLPPGFLQTFCETYSSYAHQLEEQFSKKTVDQIIDELKQQDKENQLQLR